MHVGHLAPLVTNVSLLGPLVVSTAGRTLRGRDFGGAKPRGVFELLLLARGKSVNKDVLADALWDEAPPKNVAGTIEQYVSLLRRRLCEGTDASKRVIVTEAHAYRLDTSEISVDLDRFDSLVVRAEQADVTKRRALLSDAVALAVGDLLEDEPYAPWVQWERHVYQGRISRAHMALAHDSVMVGHYACAVRHSEEALRFAPYSEHAFQTIMISNWALGRSDLARSAYVSCCAAAASLDVHPSVEATEIATAIDAGRPPGELINRYIAPWCARTHSIAPILAAPR